MKICHDISQMSSTYSQLIEFVKSLYLKEGIPLHEPSFTGNEKNYVVDCINSTFVSSVGEYVKKVETSFSSYLSSKYAVALVNGTCALHLALTSEGVQHGDEVITQAFSFIATANAIAYTGAQPLFIDIEMSNLGLSSDALSKFLSENAYLDSDGNCINKKSNRRIKACIPMHTFGMPADINSLADICELWNIVLIEDAAEAVGSKVDNKFCGTFGKMGVFSFNGNKIITAGGGGLIVTNDEEKYLQLKHLSTQAKLAHPWEFDHDSIAFNYRMPNLNAALLLAQFEQLEKFIGAKRKLAKQYEAFFEGTNIAFVKEPVNSKSNYWINAIILSNKTERDSLLRMAHKSKVFMRPAWKLLADLPMYATCYNDGLENSRYLAERIVNLPSSPII